jgi:IPT/TIG domain
VGNVKIRVILSGLGLSYNRRRFQSMAFSVISLINKRLLFNQLFYMIFDNTRLKEDKMHILYNDVKLRIALGIYLGICSVYANATQPLIMARISNFFSKSVKVDDELYVQNNKALPTIEKIEPSRGNKLGNYLVKIYGDNLLDVEMVKFGELPVLKLNIDNNHQISVVIPAQIEGSVSIEVLNANGTTRVENAFTYIGTEVGQMTGGGIVGCLKSQGGPSNLVVSKNDNIEKISWAGVSNLLGALSHLDGKSNSKIINDSLERKYGRYAAHVCKDYAVNANGVECVPGTPQCYSDWYLPAIDQLDCLCINKDKIGQFKHDNYWSSTEFNVEKAWYESFRLGRPYTLNEFGFISVRCVRDIDP